MHRLVVNQLLLLLPQCHDLTTLGFGGAVDDDALNLFLPLCPQLEHLDLRFSYELTDNSAAAVTTLTKLKTLDVSRSMYSDVLLHGLAENCPDLQTLLLEVNIDCTSAGVDHVLRQCLQLRTLHVYFYDTLPFDPPLMSKLTTLRVTCNSENDPIHLLQSIAPFCAELQHLHLRALATTFSALDTLTSENYPELRLLELVISCPFIGIFANALSSQLPTTTVSVEYVE